MASNHWKDAPNGATHYSGDNSFAKWYKFESGEWMFHFAKDIWYRSTEKRQSFFESLESRP